ncbi:MAG: FHA domain-containing protein [Spirochaetaceae bacterium]|nr:FHA domain-containing protein [Spirochaetaceae bacterium]
MGFAYCKEGHLMDPSWKRCPVCVAPLKGWLVRVKETGGYGTVYAIHEGKSFIGSGAASEIRVLDGNLARQHAYLCVGDGASIVDLGNGPAMRVNNCETVKSTLIDGDIIELAGAVFKIKLM